MIRVTYYMHRDTPIVEWVADDTPMLDLASRAKDHRCVMFYPEVPDVVDTGDRVPARGGPGLEPVRRGSAE